MPRSAILFVAASLSLASAQRPSLASHDFFLSGPPVGIRAWGDSEAGENYIKQSPLMKAREEAIISLYLAPVLVAEKIDRQLLRLPRYPLVNTTIADSLRFLHWRLLSSGRRGKGSVGNDVRAFLRRYNSRARKENAPTCHSLADLVHEYQRRQSWLDSENLGLLLKNSGDITLLPGGKTAAVASAKRVDQESEAMQKAYEIDVAEAYTLSTLDRPAEAREKFGNATRYLRGRPQSMRPQSDTIRLEQQRLLDQELFLYEGAASFDGKDFSELKKQLAAQIDLAYLAKIDHRLSDAAYQFRRAYMLACKYFPEGVVERDYSYLTYDLGETLLWDEKFDESVYYFDKCFEARAKVSTDSVSTVDTANMLGRALLRSGQAKKALDLFYRNLALVGRRNKVDLPDDDGRAPAMATFALQANADDRRQVDDALQGIIDASGPLKQYRRALAVGQILLDMRSRLPGTREDALMGLVWGMAYACDCLGEPEKSADYYSTLIKKYGPSMPKFLAFWYHGRGLDLDQSGKHRAAVGDVKKAISLYKGNLRREKDEESRDRLKWTIEDLRENLGLARRYPVSRPDYASLADNKRWRLARFPLKVFIADGRSNGFGGEMRTLVNDSVSAWLDYPGAPIKVRYVSAIDDADIFVERVTDYDDIPYSSAGRTSANYEPSSGPDAKEIDSKVLTRVHVRVYCPTYDGTTWENQALPISDEAKSQLKNLLVHEMGHAFGLTHSPAGPDIMFWKSCARELSARDIKTIDCIYGAGARQGDRSR